VRVTTRTWLERARVLADEVLFPTANEIDALPVVPRARLDQLAADGWYGIAGPSSGLDLPDVYPILAAFAGGCMTTTLVWMQHHGALAACARGPEHLQPWVGPMERGDVRASVAFAGLLPTPPLRSRADGESWVIDGAAPWVSGWGLADVVHVATRSPEDDVVWLLVDAQAAGLRAEPHRLLGLNASATVTLHFEGVRVDGDRMTSRFPWSEWPARDAAGLRTNGSVSLGVAERCCRLLGPSPLDDELVRVTADLDAGTPETFPAGRAAAAELALRAATVLLVSEGSRAVERGTHAERLYREAAVLLVYGSRPSIRRELLTAVQRSR
jgi:alkylation response protein AidB-like acyl-CoA dehydrogenase